MAKILKFKQNLDYFLNLIDTRIQDKDYLGALDASRRAYLVAKTPIDRESINLLIAEIYFYMELYSLSCEYYFRAMMVSEVSASALFGVGVNLLKMKKYELATQYFYECALTPSTTNFAPLIEECLASIPSKETSMEEKTNLLLKNKCYNEAIELLYKNSFATPNQLVRAYLASNQLDKARELIFQLLKLNPNDIEASLALCNICAFQNDLPTLATILSNLGTIPHNFSHYMTISRYYSILSKWNEVIQYLTLATQISPYSVEAETLLSLAHLNNGNRNEALFHIGRARWIDIENPLVNEISALLQKDLLTPPVAVEFSLPIDWVYSKLNDITSALNDKFCKNYLAYPWLSLDCEWCLFSHNLEFTQKIAYYLSKCKQKRILKTYQHLLLSPRLTEMQKFYLIKNVMSSSKTIFFTSNYRIKTLKIHPPKDFAPVILSAYQNAVCFCAVYDKSVNLLVKIPQIQNLVNKNALNETELTCLFFVDSSLLDKVCKLFRVEKTKILSIWNEQAKDNIE